MTIHVERVDARHLGALFMLLEIATIYAGELYGVNPLDQPGVELGKQFTYAMLGRAGRGAGATGMEPAPKAGRASTASRLAHGFGRGLARLCVAR